MAYAALCSGICLAQTGLGAVARGGLAARRPVPDSARGGLWGDAGRGDARSNIAALEAREPENVALVSTRTLGRMLAGGSREDRPRRRARRWSAMLERLACPPRHPAASRPSASPRPDIPAIVADSRGSSMQTNPIVLTDDEIASILRESL